MQQISEEVRFIDKPLGWSSHQVVNWVRQQTGEQRVGHTGTLDPLATGLLIVLVGRQATKRQQEYLKLDKQYTWQARLGVTSDTFDSTGELVQTATVTQLQALTEASVEAAIRTFTGTITQTVPAYSAIKRGGKKLYQLARSGTLDMSTLPARSVEIYTHELGEFGWQYDPTNPWQGDSLLMRGTVHCSSGTYVRTLVHDLGQLLGVGAVMTGLRRTAIGSYNLDSAEKIAEV